MKNWKTTLVGAILAAIVAIQPLFDAGEYDYKKLVFAAAIAAFGFLSKDYNVSGQKK